MVTNFGYGVLLGPGSTHSVVEGMTLYRNALAGVQLFDADNGRNGNLVRGNRFDSNGETGVQLFAGTEGSTVENNNFVSNGMSIHLDAARAERDPQQRRSAGSSSTRRSTPTPASWSRTARGRTSSRTTT